MSMVDGKVRKTIRTANSWIQNMGCGDIIATMCPPTFIVKRGDLSSVRNLFLNIVLKSDNIVSKMKDE